MTNENAIVSTASASMLAEFTGGSSGDVEMMIGIGLVKDSDAVYFRYVGDENQPQALVYDNGKPLTRLANVTLAGISVAEDVGEFNSTKLNLYLRSSGGQVIMLTSGLQTIWSQCVVNSLVGLYNTYSLNDVFTLDTWKGTAKMKPCFAAVRTQGQKVTDDIMYNQLRDARADRDQARVLKIQRDAVERLSAALGGPVEQADINVEPQAADPDANF